MPYSFYPHTADIRLKVTGSTRGEVFGLAVQAMADLIKEGFCKKDKPDFSREERLELKSIDGTSLLVDFLSEVLTLSHIRKTIFCDVIFDTLAETELKAILRGKATDQFDKDIKAVTYHEAELKKSENGQWESILVFDI
ncbi:MAG TPA: archease [Saprospiraceae bacterium]|nr:archease [Saprospiraceae bacterium]HNT21364.1 archease [Saprospiraceae bacterium]